MIPKINDQQGTTLVLIISCLIRWIPSLMDLINQLIGGHQWPSFDIMITLLRSISGDVVVDWWATQMKRMKMMDIKYTQPMTYMRRWACDGWSFEISVEAWLITDWVSWFKRPQEDHTVWTWVIQYKVDWEEILIHGLDQYPQVLILIGFRVINTARVQCSTSTQSKRHHPFIFYLLFLFSIFLKPQTICVCLRKDWLILSKIYVKLLKNLKSRWWVSVSDRSATTTHSDYVWVWLLNPSTIRFYPR